MKYPVTDIAWKLKSWLW